MKEIYKLWILSGILFLLQSCDTPYDRGIKFYDKQEYVRAAEYFKEAANEGNADAMAYLGYCYFNGIGVEQDEKQAFYWNKRGAGNGSWKARQNLSDMADAGYETAKEYKTFTERLNARSYAGNSRRYDPDDADTYTLPNDRYLATVEEYVTFLRTKVKINTGFGYDTANKYCWITSYERNKYWDIFKLANPFGPALAVDLGLSVKWASMNVGAKQPSDLGSEFAWGETSPKKDYTWLTYKYAKGSAESIMDIGENISYTEYDAASANWGVRWRMPTVDDYKELVNRCNLKWTTAGDREGLKATGPNGNSIFFPAEAISADLGSLFNTHYYTGNLRTTSGLFVNACEDAYTFKFSPDGFEFGSQSRCFGCYIRPILVE